LSDLNIKRSCNARVKSLYFIKASLHCPSVLKVILGIININDVILFNLELFYNCDKLVILTVLSIFIKI
jgi:hypothetical protein